MAKEDIDDKDDAIELDASINKGGKGKLILIIVLAILLMGGTTVGILYYTGAIGGKGDSSKDVAGEAKAKEEAEAVGPAIYYELKPEFIVNFEGNQKANYLQITMQLMTRTPGVVKILEEDDPLIRNNILLLFSGQKYDELSTLAGKEKLRAEVLKAVQQIVKTEFGKPAVEAVYFTSFIMQ